MPKKIPIIIEDRERYERVNLALFSAMKHFERIGHAVPGEIKEAFDESYETLESARQMKAVDLFGAINSDAQSIVESIIAATKDGKWGLISDLKHNVSIAQGIGSIVEKIFRMKFHDGITWEKVGYLVQMILTYAKAYYVKYR